jgi:hypothetical protein
MMMCCKQVPYWLKWAIGFVMTLMGIFVIISSWYGFGSSDEAQVVLGGEDNKAVIQQSSGFHVLELNNSGDSDGCQGWSWSEYALVIVGFILILKISHILHYFLVSKKIIKSKVAKKVALQMKDLPVIPPPEDVVVVPGI